MTDDKPKYGEKADINLDAVPSAAWSQEDEAVERSKHIVLDGRMYQVSDATAKQYEQFLNWVARGAAPKSRFPMFAGWLLVAGFCAPMMGLLWKQVLGG